MMIPSYSNSYRYILKDKTEELYKAAQDGSTNVVYYITKEIFTLQNNEEKLRKENHYTNRQNLRYFYQIERPANALLG